MMSQACLMVQHAGEVCVVRGVYTEGHQVMDICA
jgi:hypothetical protein